jgi:hypothetical protein
MLSSSFRCGQIHIADSYEFCHFFVLHKSDLDVQQCSFLALTSGVIRFTIFRSMISVTLFVLLKSDLSSTNPSLMLQLLHFSSGKFSSSTCQYIDGAASLPIIISKSVYCHVACLNKHHLIALLARGWGWLSAFYLLLF